MIFDRYTARLRSLPRPPAAEPDPLMLAHDETVAIVSTATSEMDRLCAMVDRDRGGQLVRVRSAEGR